MGNFSNNSITDVGKMLLADVQAGAVFVPTRIVIGSGSMPSGATANGMTDVITPVKSLAINKKKRTPDGTCVFGGVYTNEEVTAPFYFRELALYAKAVYLNEDGSVKSETAETLYSYGNAGATADYMPAYSTSTVVEKQMDLVVWVGNDAQVDLTIASGIYASKDEVAPAGYGLGGESKHLSKTDDLNDIIKNGWYSWHEDTPTNAPEAWGNMIVTSQSGHYTQTVFLFAHLGCSLQRTCVGDVWSEWEWDNPPMLPGIEYRTTERRNGKAVYKMLGTDGVLKYHLDGETSWKTYAEEIGAAPTGYGVGGPYYHIPPNSAITIKFDNDRNVAFIAVQGSMYTTRAVFAVNSFGIGGDTTHVERVSGREGILYGITPQSSGNGVVIFNDTADAVVRASIFVLQGVYPTVTAGDSGVAPFPVSYVSPAIVE